jgi:hypothetical protein
MPPAPRDSPGDTKAIDSDSPPELDVDVVKFAPPPA